VTAQEVTFCNLVSDFVGSEMYSCLDLQSDHGGQVYTFHLRRLGDPEGQYKVVTVFRDAFEESVRSNRLTEGIQKNLENDCRT